MNRETHPAASAHHRGRAAAVAAAVSGCALVVASAAPAAAHDSGHGHDRTTQYVALGDSYTSGPYIPTQVDANCARSDHNYPSVVTADQRGTVLKDVSCSGATTAEMWQAQGTNPPQLDAVQRDTDLVTVQIGGNDIGFSTIIGTCAKLSATDLAGNPCQRYYNSSGADQLALTILNTAPKVAKVLRAVHEKAPHARVLVVGYPDLLPDDGSGCYPSVPFAAKDFPYLRDTGKRLNLMLRLVAAFNGAEYVDTYGPTVGHDMCKAPADRWIEPLQPASPAAPAHPNAKGEAAMAGAVLKQLDRRHRY
ncbi:SGNH/GDSL hydrolase family protein [Streptomyces sp. MBT62]|uniref:SGNH/GDSL hydrolase family protein n=1 Tax=Streptomyces sp. MBT62 TaxID=2800410 RepID=UPI001909D28C|nr:SGNH/GDSL hydrolase family protein [Streptomyces sp. MBT62]MBK3567144.1 SGNH/GDSL hydrolase family protein [Streptomyces sp. MBT62]